jgi:translocation and assembly module TamB
VAARPQGTLQAAGDAALGQNGAYKVSANLDARGVAVRLGSNAISGVALNTGVEADNHRIHLSNLRLSALGGEFTGSAAVEEMAHYQVAGNLRHFDIAQISRALATGMNGYDGVISGPVQAEGDIRNSAALVAHAGLDIAPGKRGIPVSGHLGVNYNGRSGVVDVDHSRLSLPHTTLALSGSLGNSIQVHLVSRNFSDFRPIAAIPVTFTGTGSATVDAVIAGNLNAPRISAQLAANNFAVDGRAFTRFSAAATASPSGATISNATLSRGTLQAQFSASAGLRNWKPENYEPLKADLVIRDADLRDLLALAGQSSIPATGALQANAHIAGTIGSPTGAADLGIQHGTLDGESFDNLTLQAAMDPNSINVQGLHLTAGPSHIDATATYQHPVNNLQQGTVTAHVSSNQVQLAQFQSLVKDRPGLAGIVNLNADVAGSVAPAPAGFRISTLNANVAARQLQMEGKALGDFTLVAISNGSAVRYDVNSDFAGSQIRVNGQSALAGDHQTTASANISNLPLDRVLAVAGRRDIPVRGTFSANAQVSGTLQSPRGSGTFAIVNGSAYNEPFNRIQAALEYTDVLVNLSQLRIEDGQSHLELSASFNHPAGDLQDGQIRFRANSNELQLARIHTLANARPGLAGVVQLTAEGAAALHRNAPVTFSSLNAQFLARGLSMNRKALGDLSATAVTRGNGIDFNLNSDLAKSRIQGSGHLDLTAGYPVNAQLSMDDVTWSGLSPLLGQTAQPFDASLAGRVTIAGPTAQPESLHGTLQLTKLEAHSVATKNGEKAPRVNLSIRNSGDIQASLANSVLTVQHFQLTGPDTNLSLTGSASPTALNLRTNGNIKLDALQAFSEDIFSSGSIVLNAAVTGTTAKPAIHGKLQLQNASFHMMDLPNGLSNANGAINFNGAEAVIDNLNGEVGGGKITLSGYAAYGGAEPVFRIQANATRVHIDYPENITTEASARLTLAGSQSKSLLSGNVIVQNVAMHSHSDIGSILNNAATPPSAASPSTGILAGMHFDVRVRTASGAQFRTSLTQNLQADADLDLRGSPDHPGMLGRLSVTSGEIVFFGAKYTVDEGNITFYNPNKIEPILNVALETTVQGVDVTVSVSGPMDKMKLAYHSDPPLEFDQIVALLASGKTPTTDPVLASHQPPPQQQNIQQAGASMVLNQAVANPVSGRLQRLFGVSKLSIDPQIVGQTSNNPQATLTLQQQITKEITFTYIQDVTSANPSAIRIEWAINPQFSAVAQRDVYGEFALDFFYKKRFR